ncbi:MAG TPA: hypothetical protein VNV60_00920 [Holophagaceae bacterium]|jgi:hypothetical protein|nr:hypothetical protein [Holophagaceae bacterium]
MSPESADPYDKTKIMDDLPEMPSDTARIVAPGAPAPEPAPAPKPRGNGLAIALWVTAALLLTGGMTWWFLGGEASAPKAAEASTESVPPSLQGYLDAANQGDAKAMRMLGASYTYGLGVRADKAEGAAWYRKAADAGDPAAVLELKALEGKGGD